MIFANEIGRISANLKPVEAREMAIIDSEKLVIAAWLRFGALMADNRSLAVIG